MPRSDSDTVRIIREEAAVMCAKKNTRLWWVIGILFASGSGAVGFGAKLALEDHGTLREHERRLDAEAKRIDAVDAYLVRIEAKLDRLIMMQRK